ncbi:MAG TPA: hypothetical protein PKA59_05285 [Chakrabartia sp.]|jgi:hypothetical protein|nr:hypothetical protein [Chakrabartia sp.]
MMQLNHLVIVLMCAALAGCGGGDAAAPDQSTGDSGGVTAAAAPVTCKGLPDFVTLYDGAKVTLCTQGDTSGTSNAAKRTSGTIAFSAPAEPAAVLDWYKGKAHAAGLADALTTPTSYSARAPGRNMMVMVAGKGATTDVTLNWGVDGVP